MTDLEFTWDPSKAAANLRKHGVGFTEAATVFADDEALLSPDPDHSGDEERFLLLGLSASLRILVVVHCYRRREDQIRIISARRATPRERTDYETRWGT
jgi:uncharacterized DUF497 family protein